ncbi:SMARCC C-terminal [Trinorchestia longiramus]|nr:SMARCC C-terminal [Trinorchestia longiramus]
MAINPRKDGGPNAKFYESNETLTQFETVKSWLMKNCKKHVAADPPTCKGLAQLVVQLLQFMEDTCGTKASNPPLIKLPVSYSIKLPKLLPVSYSIKLPKLLPVRCFLDLKPDGGLCHIMSTVYKYKSDHSWRRFDFQSPSRREANIELLRSILSALVASGRWVTPKVCIHHTVDSEMKKELCDIVTRHSGKVVDSVSEASHVVYDEQDPLDEEFARGVLRRDKSTLFHFYYMPDSHDNWVPNIELDYDPPSSPAPPEQTPIKVCANWLQDLESYNEWMNEEDYTVDENGAKLKHPHCLSVDDTMALSDPDRKKKETKTTSKKRPRSPPSPRTGSRRKGGRSSATPAPSSSAPSPAKPSKKSRPDEEDDLTVGLDDPPPEPCVTEVTPSSVAAAAATTGRTSAGGGSASSVTGASKGATYLDMDNQEHDKAEAVAQLSEPEDTATDQTHHIIVPSYSAWFDYNAIHAIEKRGLPEFFNGKNKSKTPEIYLAYRNFMIDTYRLNPSEYLTSTACRRNLAGDVCAIMRVHAFLEQWGLINYQVRQWGLINYQVREWGLINYQVRQWGLINYQVRQWGLINYQVDTDARPTPMGPPPTSHFHVLADSPSGLQSINPIRVNQPCAAKVLDIKPKTEADSSSASPGGPTPGSDLGLRMDQYSKKGLKNRAPSAQTRDWTEKETVLLLEALELYKDDWNKVCEHVGSRTQDECILHFLRLPIEDPYLEDAGEADSVMGPLQHQPIPFSRAGNPIMSTVAFLASVVDPRIAAAAASAAMTEFCRIKEEVPAALLDAHVRTVANHVAAGNTADGTQGLDKTGIAGTSCDEDDKEKDGNKDSVAATAEKGDEKMQVDGEGKEDQEKGTGGEKKTEVEGGEKKEETGSVDENSKDAGDKGDKAVEESKAKGEEGAKESKDSTEEDSKRQAIEKLRKDASVQQAAAAALGAAAVKAKHLAAVEERKIKSLVALLVETQMKKLEIKLRHFEELETIMDRERESLELQRQQLLQEQQQFHLEQLKAAELRARQHAMHQLHQQQQHAGAPVAGAAAGASAATSAPAATAVAH